MSDFNPDEYLKEIKGDGSKFDPDKYLAETRAVSKTESGLRGAAQGASLGFADEMTGGAEALWEKAKGNPEEFGKLYAKARDESRANYKHAKEVNPKTYFTGELGGGAATALVPVGSAATLGRAAILGAGLGGAAGLGGSEANDATGMTEDMLKGAAGGAVLGAGGQVLGKGLAKVGSKISSDLGPEVARMLPIGKKANAAEIEAAANALGAKATPGMTGESETLQKLESSLHQSPTIGGWLTRRQTKPVSEAMQNATRDLTADAATISPFESGEQAKKIMSQNIGDKFKPHADAFNDLAESTKNIPSTPSSAQAVSRNIMNIPEVQTLELPLAKQIVRQLENNPSADQIKILRGIVGKQAAAADGAEASGYWQIYAKLGKLEENTIKRGAIASARKGEGEGLAQDMLGQLKGAKQGWAEQMGNLGDLSEASRIKGMNSPSAAVDKINAIPSERFQERMLPLEDNRLSQTVQKQFPEAFEGLRKARIQDLSQGTFKDGQYNPGKLLQNTKGLNPEAENMLFGGQTAKLNDLRTVGAALPDKVGPSGTQQAIDMKDMLNPINQAKDLARYGAYKYSSSDKLAKLAEFLKSKPAFQNMAESNPRAFQAAVYDMSKRIKPDEGLSKVANGPEQNRPISEDEAKDQFLNGN